MVRRRIAWVTGIDEAGRGPLLGPLVLAAVTLTPARAAALRRIGVADSKRFGSGAKAHDARRALAVEIHARGEVRIGVADPHVVDGVVAENRLNELERDIALRLLASGPPTDRVVADGRSLFAPLAERLPPGVDLLAIDGGEDAHAAVAAASIVAKVRRDELFACIARRYEPEFGPIDGGGYVNAGTRRFLRAYVRRYGRFPPEVRQSWGCDFRYLKRWLSH
jgi:ribonuclease HII